MENQGAKRKSNSASTLSKSSTTYKPADTYPDVELIDPFTRFQDFEMTLPDAGFPVLQTDMKNRPDSGEKTYKGRGRLQGLKALITGGDSGIGRAIVISYLREGAKVAINYLPGEEPDVEDLARFLKGEGLSFIRIPGDLRSETFCWELVKKAADDLGGLDIVVCNAGYASPLFPNPADPTFTFSTKELKQTFETNVYAPYFLARAAIPFLPRGGSFIVTTSSIVTNPFNFALDYGMSKGAVTYMVRSLAILLAPHGIRVNGVAPGMTYTPILAGFDQQLLDQYIPSLPNQRAAQPAELAPLYVNLAEPDKTNVTGEIFSAAGGELGA